MMRVRDALEEGRDLPDARYLLARVLERSPAWLYAWPEHPLDQAQVAHYRRLLARRRAGEPLAYLTGEKAFWSLTLQVSPATLVPRPETERLVELALELAPATPLEVLDLGTGSGAIALALAKERPAWRILATDRSPAALENARANARRLGLNRVHFLAGHWLRPLRPRGEFALILSNPPYVAPEDPHLEGDGVRHEPRQALVAAEGGLADLREIITTAPPHLRPGGALLVEHGADQGEAVRALFQSAGFLRPATHRDLAGHERVTLGFSPPPSP